MLSHPTQNVTPKVDILPEYNVLPILWNKTFGHYYFTLALSTWDKFIVLHSCTALMSLQNIDTFLPVEIISITNGSPDTQMFVTFKIVQIIWVEYWFTMNWSFSQNILHTTKDNNYKWCSLKEWLQMVIAWKLSMFSTWVIKAAIWVGFLHVRDRSSSKNPFYLLQKEL